MDTVIITGAGSGLGKALARQYAASGYMVYLTGRNEGKLRSTKREIIEQGGKAESVVCDVTEAASIEEMLKQTDKVDLLINNAGIGLFGELESYGEEDIDAMLDTNVKGTILFTQAVQPRLEISGGRVLNIISTAGLKGKVNESVYCASKFAVRGFTESLHKEWENKPIDATAVYMGGMNTPFWDGSTHVADPGKLKTPEEVAKIIFEQDDRRPEIKV
ncbi:SDR family NAD(P)-dependent oxidoreductase [Salimicrobium humidisoli]|uniref:Short-chain dehydrogenase n=1 Tax=Salimicrobium humidisoli TaxID=2029857 RepID=A0ABX4HP24_9BACI|nr:SDR family oxidoreductase [Salimicrobium humidisoli]PBB04943.1 short-chain dehydrogenase [Salimicrobium humidisoli]